MNVGDKVKWRHPSAHDADTWVYWVVGKDDKGFYFHPEGSDFPQVLPTNKGLIYEKI